MLRQALHHLNNDMLSLSRASPFSPALSCHDRALHACISLFFPSAFRLHLYEASFLDRNMMPNDRSWGHQGDIQCLTSPVPDLMFLSRLKEQSVSSFGCLLVISA